MTTEPKYDEDVVNLGYLKKIVADPEGNLENIYENVSKHYASKPQPPYHKGDTWIDGNIIYTCINDREIGTYQDSDWTTESGAREEAENKNKVFLRQPSNYSVGDMWILQSDDDHKAGKKGEILISTAGRSEYNENDWVNMLGYGTIRSINEVANNINDALKRLKIEKEEGIITIFYSNAIPENPILNDLWYVTESIDEYSKEKLYKYNGDNWELIKNNLITVAFEEANQDRLISDGKIQSFYTNIAPLDNIGVGDIWNDTTTKKLYRYNGTNWIAVYDTNINEIRKNVETVTETTVQIQTDLGGINQRVNTVETTITTLGQIEKAEGKEITVDASNNPAKLYCYGNTEQETSTRGKNLLDQTLVEKTVTKNNFTFEQQENGSIRCYGNASVTTAPYFELKTPIILPPGTYTFSPTIVNNSGRSYSMSCRLLKTDNSSGDNSFGYNSGTTWISLSNSNKITETLTETTKFTHLYIYTNANYETDITVNFQVESGNSRTTFEQFIPNSPSPDYPSYIRNVGDNINIIDITTLVPGYVGSNGSFYDGSNGEKRSDFIKVEPNTEYSFKIHETSQSYNDWIGIGEYSSNNASTFIQRDVKSNSSFTEGLEYTITTSATTQYIVVSARNLVGATKIKLEKGKVATNWTEYGYGSVGFKEENGNIFDEKIELGSITDDTGINFTSNENYRSVNYVKTKENNNYCFSINNNLNRVVILCYDKNKEFVSRIVSESGKFTTLANTSYIKFRSYNADKDLFATGKIMLNEGTEIKTYIPHEEQTVVFPLSEGQLLHKGDYLAEDGIHQVKGTLVLDGTETWQRDSLQTGCSMYSFFTNILKDKIKLDSLCECTHLKYNNDIYYVDDIGIDINWAGAIRLKVSSEIQTINQLKLYLAEQYANGTPVIVEYLLKEEVVIPYTPEQQKVLDSIETFKGINHIYCIDEIEPERMILTYYPNTPYNDTLVNKDTFDKVTTEMNAEFNIRANEVETSVREQTTASILTLLNNNYATAEQVNALVQGNAEDIATVKEQLTQTVTSSQMQIEITKAIEGGVSYLKNTLFTIDENGMAIATKQDEFSALYTNRGMELYSYEELIAKFDVNGATVQGNLNLNGELITPNLRMMNADVDGVPHTHIHWIGG